MHEAIAGDRAAMSTIYVRHAPAVRAVIARVLGLGPDLDDVLQDSFATAFRRHRCLLPADGFYEWQVRGNGGKQPMRVGMKDGSVFGLAGLYERWLSPEGEPLDTCTILTTEANALLRDVHPRMPVIIAPEAYEQWLDPTEADAGALVAAFDPQPMTYWPVSTRVNSVKNDDADIIEPHDPRADEPPAEPVQEELPVEADDDEIDVPTQAQLF